MNSSNSSNYNEIQIFDLLQFFFFNTNSAQGYVFVSLYCLVLQCMMNLMLIPVKQQKHDKGKNYLSNHFFSLTSESLKNKLLNQLYTASQLGIQDFLFSENVNRSETDVVATPELVVVLNFKSLLHYKVMVLPV